MNYPPLRVAVISARPRNSDDSGNMMQADVSQLQTSYIRSKFKLDAAGGN